MLSTSLSLLLPLCLSPFSSTLISPFVPRHETKRGGRRGASGGRAARRSDPYARDTRARGAGAAPPLPQQQQQQQQYQGSQYDASGMSYPPPEFSIRGTSGPTWIVVSNLVMGTSNEDVRLTFGAFGKVEDVKQRPAPSSNHPTVSFEVAFDRKEDAEMAVSKFNGALADGRILQVSIKKPDVPRDAYSQFSRATAQAVAQRPRERGPSSATGAATGAATNMIPAPAPLPYTPAPAAAVAAAIPTAPASMRTRARAAELLEPRARKNGSAASNAAASTKSKSGSGAAAAAPASGKKGATAANTKGGAAASAAAAKPLAQRIPQPLANRLLTPAQAQKLKLEEAKKKARDEARARAIAATGKNTQLGKRLGGLPLAQRLVQQAGTPKSDTTAIKAAAEKKKRKKEAAKARRSKKPAAGSGGAAGMDVDV
ncbi:hypothetical protein BCV70DRAFT_211653 [Testicularia cyperi]|uniref:RRM domain-containing protein n=1 Tax=Testicularia cyperi TaxID=1882483 RepID=A0A317XP24_9BASI|nr:hypothetical protein BCV70DRAFT_211653 [Testicularia cyperi]